MAKRKIVPPREAFEVTHCGECPYCRDASELFRIICEHKSGLNVTMKAGTTCPPWCPLEDAPEEKEQDNG